MSRKVGEKLDRRERERIVSEIVGRLEQFKTTTVAWVGENYGVAYGTALRLKTEAVSFLRGRHEEV